MWPARFEDRLASWHNLRESIPTQPIEIALAAVNSWWAVAPWTAYHLHWDDYETWPNPWQLLDDNLYCDVAKCLGICYTLTLAEHPDIQDFQMVLTEEDHIIVVACNNKYILNWEKELLLNTDSNYTYKKIITEQDIKQKY
jgi:hypothetical protein